MNAKNLKLGKDISWGLAGVTMFLLILGNQQNNVLNAATFVLIIAGIIFSYFHDKRLSK